MGLSVSYTIAYFPYVSRGLRHRFSTGEPVDTAAVPFAPEEADLIPHDAEIRGLEFLGEEQMYETEGVELRHETTTSINSDRYVSYVYPRHDTARVYYREHEEGKMACAVKKAYLSLKSIHVSNALRSQFSVSLNKYSKEADTD